jgi:hypothetical protein
MTAGEPNLVHICRLVAYGRVSRLIRIQFRVTVRISFYNLDWTEFVFVSGLNAKPSFLSGRSVPQVCFEVGTAFVKGNGVAKRSDDCVGCGEGKSARDDSHRIDGVPIVQL